MLLPNTRGEWLADHTMTDTVMPSLSHMLETQYPLLVETIERVAPWTKERSDAQLPRFLDKTNYQIEGIEEQRMVNSYAQWMLQHPLGFADSLAPIERRNIRLFANAKS